MAFPETSSTISRPIGRRVLRFANPKSTAMYLNIPKTKQVAILCIKIQEIEMCDDYSQKDKAQMKQFYRKKLKMIQPKVNF